LPRILHIIPSLTHGGPEKQLVLLAHGLKQRGWDVHVCCLKSGGPLKGQLDAADVPVAILGKPWKLDPVALWRLRRHIAALQPDIVHTWRPTGNRYGGLAATSCGVQHIVATAHTIDPKPPYQERLIDRLLIRRTAKIAANSQGIVDVQVGNGLPPEKFTVVPYGIRDDHSHAGDLRPEDRASVLADLGLPGDSRLIGAVGELRPHKRYKDLLWSLDLLRCFYHDVHFLILGDGPQRWRLERYARQLTSEAQVHFLGERHDVARILPHLACFLSGSAGGGQSLAMLEAMLAGVPVVASDIPAHRDFIASDATGFLVPVGDRAAFASRTREILENPGLGEQLGRAGRERVLREFTAEQMIERFQSLYRELLAS
jgi:glycosyltransferase involved in cell wall biosynthesis